MSGDTHTRPMTTVLKRREAAKAAAAAPKAAKDTARKPHSITVATVLTTVLALAASLIGWFGVVSCRESIERKTREMQAFRREIDEMRTVIAGRDETLKAIAETLRTHASLSGTYLEPLLDSYAMRAKTLLEAEADAAGISSVSFTDVKPYAVMPAVTPVSRSPYVLRSVRVTANGSYQRLATFLCRIERLFPTVLVDSVSITSDFGREATQQRGEFVFCWLSARDGEGSK